MRVVGDNSRDEAIRERIRTDLNSSMLVEAAAGTGKTTQLVERLVAVIETGTSTVDKIVAVTFTRKAAGELKLRLRQRLEDARVEAADEQVRSRVESAIAHLEETRIGTIHSFCAELLRQRPVEAGVDPGFAEVADDEGPKLFARAFDRWIQDQFQVMPEGLRRALSRLALESPFQGGVRRSPIERLRAAAWTLAEWRDYPTDWQRPPFDRAPLIDRLVDLVSRLASHARRANRTGDPLRRSLEPIVLLDTFIRRAGFDLVPREEEAEPEPLPEGVVRFVPSDGGAGGDQVRANPFLAAPGGRRWSGSLKPRDYDALEARLLDLRRELRRPYRGGKGRGKYAEALPREQVIEERDLFIECLDHFRRVADADLAALLQRELREVLPGYEEVKRAEGRLDFSDLLLLTRRLLVRSKSVRNELQQQISHLFIDEFQDTDPVQAEVLLLLCADDPDCVDWRVAKPAAGKLFAVGDPKQSIYRFRRADVRLYEGIKTRLSESGVAVLDLGRSFRSNATIQRLVNTAFAPRMTGDFEAGHPHYLPLEESRPEIEGQPAVVALPVPEPYGWKSITQTAVKASEPQAVAAYCDWLLNESGFRVQRGDSTEPVSESDVCILFRRYMNWGTDVTRAYTQALEDRGIRHLLIGARTFHQREEVETLRAALLLIERPDDELASFATLRGSLFAFSDERLLRFRAATGGFTVFAWRRYRRRSEDDNAELSADFEPIGAALEALQKLHWARNRRAVVETVQELLTFTRARAGFALRPAGHQVLANVERVCELARSYEMAGGRSFRGFVEHLEAQAREPGGSESPVVEDGAEGVRIMTVHGAKGLEFPVVILADMTAKLARAEPDLAVDAEAGLCATRLLGCAPLDLIQRTEMETARDQAEGVRVAYVAATRARDLLVVPAVGDQPLDGWLSPLNDALYPEDRQGSRSAPGCPEFSSRSVLRRPEEIEREMLGSEDPSVRPGLHALNGDFGGYSVTWWDPAVLNLDARREVGLARENLLMPTALIDSESPAPAVERNSERYQEWKRRRGSIVAAGSRASRSVMAVTGLESEPPGGLRDVHVVSVRRPEREGRPSGQRFGELVHSVLRLVNLRLPIDELTDEARQLATTTARILGAPDRERDAVVEAISGFATSEIGSQVAAADGLWREFPLATVVELPDEEGGVRPVVIDAVIDLLFRRRNELVLVDFKTDAISLVTGDGTPRTANPDSGTDEVSDGSSAFEKYQRQLSWYAELLERSGNLEALHGPPDPAAGQSRNGGLSLKIVQL